MDAFHHHLLRVLVAQILRSRGFDQATPDALNVATDVFRRWLERLTAEVRDLARLHGGDPTPADIAQALDSLGALAPTTLLDPYDSVYKTEVAVDESTNAYTDGVHMYRAWVALDETAVTRATASARAAIDSMVRVQATQPVVQGGGALQAPSAPDTSIVDTSPATWLDLALLRQAKDDDEKSLVPTLLGSEPDTSDPTVLGDAPAAVLALLPHAA